MRFTDYFGKPIYIVTITRTDMDEEDTVHLAAWSASEVKSFCRRMYGDRLRRIISVKRERA